MAINGIQPLGDDQRWKEEVERELQKALQRILILERQLNARGQ